MTLVERLEAELAQAARAGEPEEWAISISKSDIRNIIALCREFEGLNRAHMRAVANAAVQNIKRLDEPWDGIPAGLLYRESGNG